MDMNQFSLVKHDPEILELLATTEHKAAAQWALDCLNRVLPVFEGKYPDEKIPMHAVQILKDWMNDKILMWEARKYCWTLLKLVRELEPQDKASCQIVRAASHCLATCHVPTHSEGTAMYAISAIQHLNREKSKADTIARMESERQWQMKRLLELREKSVSNAPVHP